MPSTTTTGGLVAKLQFALALVVGLAAPIALGSYAESRAPGHATVHRLLLFLVSLPLGALLVAALLGTLRVLLPASPARTIGSVFACIYAWYAGFALLDAGNCLFDRDVRATDVRWVSYDRPTRGTPTLEATDPVAPDDTFTFADQWVGGAIGTRIPRGTPIRVRWGEGAFGFRWIAEVTYDRASIRW